ncbi:MAG: hypothetical protein KC656_15270, partial [Myxococcales bacterium]|nr:hypothetical protein [Myxococcales bacterium]
DWIEAVIDEAIDMETQPGTSPDGSDEQRARLRAFFEAHPEYREASERQKLADLACAFGIEDAHAKLTSPEPRTPLTVTVTADGWKLVVAHASDWCTSDDWAWFTNDVQTAVTAKGVLWDYAGARNDAVVVMRDGAELVRVPLEGQGYLVLGDGVEKAEIGHDMADGVITSIGEHFGMELGATE